VYTVFDYKCVQCGHRAVDQMVRTTKKDKQFCPSCNATLVRMPAGTPTTFKFADTKLKRNRS